MGEQYVHPAEALATGRPAAVHCPSPNLCPKDPGEDLQGLLPALLSSPPRLEDVSLPSPPEDTTLMSNPPAEALATGQSAAGLCPSLPLHPAGHTGKDPHRLHAQQPMPPPGASGTSLQRENAYPGTRATAHIHPAEALATRQSAAGLYPPSKLPSLLPENPSEDLQGLLPTPLSSPPRLEDVSLPSPPEDTIPVSTPPAEALATGQSAAGLCPPYPSYGLYRRQDLCGLSPQPPVPQPALDLTATSTSPAEALATGQSAAGLCPPSTAYGTDASQGPRELISQQPMPSPGASDPSLPQEHPFPGTVHAAEELAPGQSAAGLCPPTKDSPEDPGKDRPGLLTQQPRALPRREDANLPAPTPLHAAEALTTGQSAAGLCPFFPFCPADPGEDHPGLPAQQPTIPPTRPLTLEVSGDGSSRVMDTPASTLPAEALASGQSLASLCPPTRPLTLEVSGILLLRVIDTPALIHPAEARMPGQSTVSLCPPTRSLIWEVSDTVWVIDTPGEGTGGTSPHPPAGHRSAGCPSDSGPTPRDQWRGPGARLLPTDYGPHRLSGVAKGLPRQSGLETVQKLVFRGHPQVDPNRVSPGLPHCILGEICDGTAATTP